MLMPRSLLFLKVTGNARRDNLHTYLVKLWCSRRSSIYTGRSTSITDICVSFFIFTMLCVSNFLDLKKRFLHFICVHLIWHFKLIQRKICTSIFMIPTTMPHFRIYFIILFIIFSRKRALDCTNIFLNYFK